MEDGCDCSVIEGFSIGTGINSQAEFRQHSWPTDIWCLLVKFTARDRSCGRSYFLYFVVLLEAVSEF